MICLFQDTSSGKSEKLRGFQKEHRNQIPIVLLRHDDGKEEEGNGRTGLWIQEEKGQIEKLSLKDARCEESLW